MIRQRAFWIVSPNVRFDFRTQEDWKKAIIRLHSAFMGWRSDEKDHPIGRRFAYDIKLGDVILVARSHHRRPDIVGCGIVTGEFEGYEKSLGTPQEFGSRRLMQRFKKITRIPQNVPIMSVLRHVMSLRKLHPNNPRFPDDRRVCEWLAGLLKLKDYDASKRNDIRSLIRELKLPKELEYQIKNRKAVTKARKDEAALLIDYRAWLARKGRMLHLARYGRLCCDAYERKANNLIEAKRSAKREYIRMAVGQLLDYAHAGRKEFGRPKMAILLPNRPALHGLEWLEEKGIHLVWKEGKIFRDNFSGQFS
jgi:hypothetical protein